MEDKIAAFVKKKRVIKGNQGVEIKEKKIPWYLKPILKESFSVKEGKDGMLYVHHEEWSPRVWIGGYKTKKDVEKIINSYVTESLKGTLQNKTVDSIHSLIVEDEKSFFKKRQG
jgi:hypothetical protein